MMDDENVGSLFSGGRQDVGAKPGDSSLFVGRRLFTAIGVLVIKNASDMHSYLVGTFSKGNWSAQKVILKHQRCPSDWRVTTRPIGRRYSRQKKTSLDHFTSK
jgi:hypothetical protein